MTPTNIKILQKQKVMQLSFAGADDLEIPLAVLRARSPSAENRAPEPKDPAEFADITAEQIEPVGNYGIKISFSDGHATGIYRWEYLCSGSWSADYDPGSCV